MAPEAFAGPLAMLLYLMTLIAVLFSWMTAFR
jgi:hypothetical protein